MDFLFGSSKKGRVSENSRTMYNLCLKRARSIGHADYVRTGGADSLEEKFKRDMLSFLIYLVYSDGHATKEEIKFINSLMGLDFTAEIFEKYAVSWDLKGESIREQLPLSLAPFVRSNIGAETGELSSQYYDLITLYVTSFNYIGNDLISCNEDVCPAEVESLSAYINMLRNGIEEIKYEQTVEKPTIAFKPGSKVRQTKLYEEREPEFRIQPDVNYEDRRMSIKNESAQNTESGEDAVLNQDNRDTTSEVVSSQEQIEKLLLDLNELIGMDGVKQEINNLINLIKICNIRKAKGLKLPPTTNHLVFLGNPGTGKTTVARILSKIYKGLGVLSKGHLVEVDRSGLVAGYMGQTAEKVMEVVESAKGGILFIDEAYALSTNKQEGDFGQEAVDTLNKAMEDLRDDLVVIAAGYHDEMQDFLDANPGLRSRFNRTIEFPNYSAEELFEIVDLKAKKLDYRFEENAKQAMLQKFTDILANPPVNFGNARSARNYLENAISNQANRLVKSTDIDENELTVIKLEDIENLELS